MEKDYTKLSKEILGFVGGEENIEFVTNCATRLRFNLKDKSKSNTEAIKNLEGILDVVDGEEEYQICVGTDVIELFDEFKKVSNLPEEKYIKKKGTIFETISGLLSK